MLSSQLLLNFSIDQLIEGIPVSVLSVFNGKLLVGADNRPLLYICSREGHYLSAIANTDNDVLYDVTWTPLGNIVYTTWSSHKVVVMSESGKVITRHTEKISLACLSVSHDDIIYLADIKTGVHQSTNDGFSWSFVFKSTNGWSCWQVIKVTTDHKDDFWVLGYRSDDNHQLRVYSVDNRRSDGNVTWKHINVPTTDDKYIRLLHSRLSYDGNMNIFLSDRHNAAVHVLSVNGQYHRQLLSSHHFQSEPIRLAIDKQLKLLYVGQWNNEVGVFKLMYGNEG